MRICLAGALLAVAVAGGAVAGCGSIAVQKDGGSAGDGSGGAGGASGSGGRGGATVDAGTDASSDGCASNPKATTCNGKCGLVVDNCGIHVDCGTTQCAAPLTCGGDPTMPNVCGCMNAPMTTTCNGKC